MTIYLDGRPIDHSSALNQKSTSDEFSADGVRLSQEEHVLLDDLLYNLEIRVKGAGVQLSQGRHFELRPREGSHIDTVTTRMAADGFSAGQNKAQAQYRSLCLDIFYDAFKS